mgnify:CR=1 FL=1
MHIMSYNVHHGVGMDDELDLARIAQIIMSEGIEVAGLQEVDKYFGERSGHQDQAKEIADMLGYHYCYGANVEYGQVPETNKTRQYGTAIISKHSIISFENTLLSSFGEEQRGILKATINYEDTPIHVYNTHLALNEDQRATQIKEIIQIMSKEKGPKVLLGDFNMEPTLPSWQYLIKETGFTDCFADVQNADTFPSTNPNKRIDFLLINDKLTCTKAHVVHSLASDHLPLIAQLKFIK